MIELILKKSNALDDWYVLERKDHNNTKGLRPSAFGGFELFCSSRIGDADVEGTREEWLEIADALERGVNAESDRCAARLLGGGYVFFSPRNTTNTGPSFSLEYAQSLAAMIREVVS